MRTALLGGLIAICGLGLVGMTAPSLWAAADPSANSEAPAGAGRTPLPDISEGRGEQCVEPTEVMRRDHMEFILHQRDDTMRRGIRTSKHSLIECIECHVQPGADGQYPDIASAEHFCAGCHQYAAVSIDCFQCHASKPAGNPAARASSDTGAASGMQPPSTPFRNDEIARIERFLNSGPAPATTLQ